MTSTRKRVGILVFPEVEVLDFCGPFEVFSVTRLDEARRREEPSPFDVRLVAETTDTIVATGGLRVVPDVTLGIAFEEASMGPGRSQRSTAVVVFVAAALHAASSMADEELTLTDPTGSSWLYGASEADISNLVANQGVRLIDIEVEGTDPMRFSAVSWSLRNARPWTPSFSRYGFDK